MHQTFGWVIGPAAKHQPKPRRDTQTPTEGRQHDADTAGEVTQALWSLFNGPADLSLCAGRRAKPVAPRQGRAGRAHTGRQ